MQLSTEERLYLHAARVGDYGLVREILDCADHHGHQSGDQFTAGINVNCIDYMGRNALHLAVDSENIECVELLLDRLSWECQEEVNTCRLSISAHATSSPSYQAPAVEDDDIRHVYSIAYRISQRNP